MSATKKPGKGIVAVILTLFNFIILVPYLGPAALLPEIMGDLNAPISMGGYVITIYLIMCGVFMFIGTIICNKIGFRETFLIGVVFVTVGLFVSAFAGNFGIYFAGRVISGIGFGISQVSRYPVLAMWFEGKQYATMQTVLTVSACLGVAVAYVVFPAFGTWQLATLVSAIVTLLYAIVSVIWFKYPAGVGAQLKQERTAAKAGNAPKKKSEFGRVFKYKDFVLQLVFSLFITSINALLLTYLVTYFTTEVGMPLLLAATISSVMTAAQIVGTILAGVLMNVTGRRKPIIVISLLLYGLSTLAMLIFTGSTVFIFICAAINGIAYYMRMPVMGMYMIEETETPEPAFVAPIVAITNGIPMLFSLVGSAIGAILVSNLGVGTALIVLHVIALLMCIPALFMDEVGPKSKRAKAAALAAQGQEN